MKSSINKMKDGVVIICAARGGVIEEGALLAALESGKVAGVGLDVFEAEPPESGSSVPCILKLWPHPILAHKPKKRSCGQVMISFQK
jgi:phosphoglycerate dehydrogenase-like enzyme